MGPGSSALRAFARDDSLYIHLLFAGKITHVVVPWANRLPAASRMSPSDVPVVRPRWISRPVARTNYADNIYWVYGIVLDDAVAFDAKDAMKRLAEKGIGTRPFFWCMHEQPVLRRMGLFEKDSHPNAERIARRGFYLPSGLALTEDQIARSASALKEILA